MNNEKLLLILQTFSEKELASFQDFLNSPFFNKNQQAVALFLSLRPYAPERLSELPDKLNFFRRHWPQEDWDLKKVGYQMSQLNKLAESFLAIQNVQEDEHLMMLRLMDSLSQKGLEKAYQQINRQLEEKIDSVNNQDRQRFFNLFQHAEVQDGHFRRRHQRKINQPIQRVAAQLDRYYFAYRLHIVCEMLTQQTILNIQHELNLSLDWIAHLKNKSFFQEPIIEIYYTIYQTLTEQQNHTHFARLKVLLNQHQEKIEQKELADIYLLAINYGLRQIRQANNTYIKETLDLYQTGIDSQALYQEGFLSPWTFTNVVKLFLMSRNFPQAEVFIKKYQSQLAPAFTENAVHYNLADLYYHTQRYNEAQEQLNRVEYTDLNFYLGARELLAKIYYDTGEEETLLSLIASFTIFLKRNKKISQNVKTPYLNFCQILFKIVRQSKRDKATLEEEISRTSSLASRAWLKGIYEKDVASFAD